ncbi:hypothetical protein L3V79_01480 [Thiotrichales bacterium 19S9-12]|nr:hypothetical protein [Thiotrichales bacterium 19S9-11]MCF6811026.1 hypothetical protein [Thiotrichales bacterium 19S9-12]
MVDYDAIVKNFTLWVEKERNTGSLSSFNLEDNTQLMSVFLYTDKSKEPRGIKTYEEFCMLFEAAKKSGMSIEVPDKIDFVLVLLANGHEFFEDINVIVSDVSHIEVAARQFDNWVKLYNLEINNKSLLEFLSFDQGDKLIQDYDSFCQFTQRVKTNHPDARITNPACTLEEFESGMIFEQEPPKIYLKEKTTQLKRSSSCEF